jgi:hypothetical protein
LIAGTRRLATGLVFGLAVLGVAGCLGPQASPITISTGSGLHAPSRSPFGERFFIGAWCSPSTSTTDAEIWRRFARTGMDVAVRPLEDTNDRTRNLATLGLLDTLRSVKAIGSSEPPQLFVRDDAVHPDEPTRSGWRDRVRAVTAAYKAHRSLAAYFVADEPSPADFDRVAQVTAAFREFDGVHPAYVNLLPLRDQATVAEQEHWRADAARLIRNGRLQLFSFAAYSQRAFGEDATFLLTLQNAQRVSRETGCPFATVLQFTGFGPLAPIALAQMNYLAAEAVAYGAIGIIWFTYWTPNPQETGMWWKGGAVEYDGAPSARADTLLLANTLARTLAHEFQARWPAVGHFGGAWPRGAVLTNQRIPGLASTSGGPLTIADTPASGRGRRTWLVINRDRVNPRTFVLRFERSVGPEAMLRPLLASANWQRLDSAARSIDVRLDPGESALLELVER